MQKNRYYSLPLKLSDLTQQRIHETCGLKRSVAQYIHLITTSYLGEFTVDPDFGCSIWNHDFDNTLSDNTIKEGLKQSLNYALKNYEKRIHNTKVSVTITQKEVEDLLNSRRVKKRIELEIKAILSETNENFSYFEYFYLGPLSYY